ncbi:MAG: hypothetical protein LV481_00625 [Methylacidiphilales bacterium]|nr:hypothetical protein [Candidatus Methylacidiphilales bacterium]
MNSTDIKLVKMSRRAILILLIAGQSFAGHTAHSNTGQISPLSNAQILVIRHAEKPDIGEKLSDAGYARANACVKFFSNYKIDYIFANEQSHNSNRPAETVEPLAHALHLKVNKSFKNNEFAELAAYLENGTFAGKTILICWHHGEIPELLNSLGCDANSLLPPKGKWPKTVFGWLVQIKYDAAGIAHATVINEHLMPDDVDQKEQ